MNDIAAMIADSYNKNTYNINCRDKQLLQQDREFFEMCFERMVLNRARYRDEMEYTPKFLELGCGIGVPYTKEFVKYGKLLGCDVSENQVACARMNVPSGRFIQKDIMDLHL